MRLLIFFTFTIIQFTSSLSAQYIEDLDFSVEMIDVTKQSTERTGIVDNQTTNDRFYFTTGINPENLMVFDGEIVKTFPQHQAQNLRLPYAWEAGVLIRVDGAGTELHYLDDTNDESIELFSLPEGLNFHQGVINDYVISVGKDNKLYSTGGTPVRTNMILDQFDESETWEGIGDQAGEYLYFHTNDKVYRTDGTAAGTRLFWEGPIRQNFGFKLAGERVVFKSENSLIGCSAEGECETIISSSSLGNLPTAGFINLGLHAVFDFHHPDYGREIWRTDGTAAGTVLVTDLNPGTRAGANTLFTTNSFEHDGKLYFKGTNTNILNSRDSRVWKTDGTEEGTRIASEFSELGTINQFWDIMYHISTPDGTKHYFSTDASYILDDEVWGVGIGENDEMQLLGRTRRLPESTNKYYLGNDYIIMNTANETISDPSNLVYALTGPDQPMIALDSFISADLLAPAGDKFVVSGDKADLFDPQYDIYLLNLATQESIHVPETSYRGINFSLNNQLFFINQNTINGTSIWETDGTLNGTKFVADINPGTDDSDFYTIMKGGGKLYVETGGTLYSSGGTPQSTQAVSDYVDLVRMEAGTSTYVALRNFQENELFISDGTPEGSYVHQRDLHFGQVFSPTVALGEAFFYTTAFSLGNDSYLNALVRLSPESGTTDTLLKVTVPDRRQEFKIHATNDLVFCHLQTTSPSNLGSQRLVTSDGTPSGTIMHEEVVLHPSADRPLFYSVNDTSVVIQTNNDGGITGKLELTTNGVDFFYITEADVSFTPFSVLRTKDYVLLKNRNQIISFSGVEDGNPESSVIYDALSYSIEEMMNADSNTVIFTERSSNNFSYNLLSTNGTEDNTIFLNEGISALPLERSVLLKNRLLFINGETVAEIELSSGDYTLFDFSDNTFEEIHRFGPLQILNGNIFFIATSRFFGQELNYLRYEPDFLDSLTPEGHNEELKNSLSVFPNPTDGTVTLTSDGDREIEVTVLNLLGTRLFSSQFQERTSINLGHLNSGTYILQATEHLTGRQTSTLIVRK